MCICIPTHEMMVMQDILLSHIAHFAAQTYQNLTSAVYRSISVTIKGAFFQRSFTCKNAVEGEWSKLS